MDLCFLNVSINAFTFSLWQTKTDFTTTSAREWWSLFSPAVSSFNPHFYACLMASVTGWCTDETSFWSFWCYPGRFVEGKILLCRHVLWRRFACNSWFRPIIRVFLLSLRTVVFPHSERLKSQPPPSHTLILCFIHQLHWEPRRPGEHHRDGSRKLQRAEESVSVSL